MNTANFAGVRPTQRQQTYLLTDSYKLWVIADEDGDRLLASSSSSTPPPPPPPVKVNVVLFYTFHF